MKKTIIKWIIAAGIRAIKTFCQTAIATIGTSAVIIQDVNWPLVLSASGLAAIVSILTSVVTGLPEIDVKSIFTRKKGGKDA